VAVEGALYTVSNDLTFRQHDVASGACRFLSLKKQKPIPLMRHTGAR